MTLNAGDRRVFNADEQMLIRRGRYPDAKVMWHRRYARASDEEKRAMVRSVFGEGSHPDGCTGKVRHDFKRDALAAIRNATKRRTLRSQAGRSDVAPYKCQLCGGWHVGSSPL